MTEWYNFSNVKSSKMLSFDSVAEAYGLIYPRLFGENFSSTVMYTISISVLTSMVIRRLNLSEEQA